MSLEDLARVVFALGDPIGAIRGWSRARKLGDDIGSPLPPGERLRYDEQPAAARTAVGDVATSDQAREEGVAMTLEDAVACVLRDPFRSSN